MEPQPLKLRYTGCGSETRAPCDCGKPFKLIRPAKAAALAVKAHPRKSDRAIVSEIGVNDRCCSIESTKQTATSQCDAAIGWADFCGTIIKRQRELALLL